MELQFSHPEFKKEVRTQLGIFDRPLTEEDALTVEQLDLSNFDFQSTDRDTLALCKNLKSLAIEIGAAPPSFWHNFTELEDLLVICWGDRFDFKSFERMKNLRCLTVSGGDYSDIDYVNLDALIPLEKLSYLELHEFGSVDLLALASMPQLKEFSLRYANEVEHLNVIGTLPQLTALTLHGLHVTDLAFLDSLPSHLQLEMCGIHVYGTVAPEKWKRFAKRDICEISAGDNPYACINLACLED